MATLADMAKLAGMTPEQADAYLEQLFAGGVGSIGLRNDNPMEEGGGRRYYADALGNEYNDIGGKFQRNLTGDFDPAYAGGVYGGYQGTYDPAGNLLGVDFQKGERHDGYLGENLDWLGPLLVGGFAGLGAGGFLPNPSAGAGGAGWVNGFDLAGGGSLGGAEALGGLGTDAMALGGQAADTLGAEAAGGWVSGESLPLGEMWGGASAAAPAAGMTMADLAKYMPLISGGVNLANGVLGAYTSNKAADIQQNAAQDNINLATKIYEQNREDYKPWLDAGRQGLNSITSQMDRWQTPFTGQDIYRDPSYDFRFNEGQRALENSASARGQLLSGQHLKDLVNYGQSMASTEYGNAFNRYEQSTGNAFNRLAGVAGIGQAAQGAMTNAGNLYGQNVMGNTNAGANARASGYTGVAGSLGNAGNNFMDDWMQAQWLQTILGGRNG